MAHTSAVPWLTVKQASGLGRCFWKTLECFIIDLRDRLPEGPDKPLALFSVKLALTPHSHVNIKTININLTH